MVEPADVITNAMTIDVEDYFHVAALSGSIARSDWDRMEYRAEQSTEQLLRVFAEKGVRATFFILGWVAKRSPDLVRRIHAAGHEIACHGMSHQLIYTQTPEGFRRETVESKKLLEDLTGDRIFGYRGATYSITRQSLWALDVILEAGFEYDSSIFPIRHDLYGIPEADVRPGHVRTPKGRIIREFPMSTVEVCGVRIPVSGGGYFRLLPYWVTRKGLAKLNLNERRPFIFYLHPWEIDVGQPSIKVNWRSRIRHYTNIGRAESRLRCLLGEFRFTNAYTVLKAWLPAVAG